MTEGITYLKMRFAVLIGVILIVSLVLFAACGDDPERAPVRTSTPGVEISGEIGVMGVTDLLEGERNGQLHVDDVAADGRTMLLRVSNPADGTACSKLVSVSLDGQVKTLAADASIVRFGEPTGHAEFAPDGSRLAYLGTGDCTNRTSAELKTLSLGDGTSAVLDTQVVRIWSWTDTEILYSKADAPGVWSTTEGGTPTKVSEESPVDVSSNGQVSAFLDPTGTAFQARGGNKVTTAVVPPDASRSFLSPDGSVSPGLTADEQGAVVKFAFLQTASGTETGAIDGGALTAQKLVPPFAIGWAQDGSVLFAQGGSNPGEALPPAYALNPQGDFVGVLEDGGTGLGAGLISRGSLLFVESGNQIRVAVLSGMGPEADGQALQAEIDEVFPEPLPMTFNTVP
jgi:hypothetical protein